MKPATNLLLATFLVIVSTITGSKVSAESRASFPHGSVEMISNYTTVATSTPLLLGVHFKLEPGWHIYWKNPGDTGIATAVKWSVPAELSTGELNWPVPEEFSFGDLLNFGYKDSALLFSSVKIPSTESLSGLLNLRASVSWVLCNEECIPGNAELELTLPAVASEPVPSKKASLFARARKALPLELPKATFEDKAGIVTLSFGDQLKGEESTRSALFFPEIREQINSHIVPELTVNPGGSLIVTLRADSTAAPKGDGGIKGILVLPEVGGLPMRAYSVSAERRSSEIPAAEKAPHGYTFLLTLLSAFIGGLILNLMPCVFPVLSIKVLGFVQSAGSKGAPLHGLIFSLGVMISFWLLALAMFVLRAGGGEVGWGFQFQSPQFVAFMGYLVFAIGLNLVGVFEIGGRLQSAAGRYDCSSGFSGSFFSGMLATLLATPCTAPFMASALGAALILPPFESFAIFSAIGLGMASPYLILPFFPAALRFLPRPGEWLNGFKQLLAFPMFATACWLSWILAQQVELSQLMTFLFGLLSLSFGLWLYGRWAAPHRGLLSRRLGAGVALALMAFTWEYGSPSAAAVTFTPCSARKPTDQSSEAISWEEYSSERLSSLLKDNRPVLIDFSAAWCLTCQLNHKMALNSKAVADELQAKGIVSLRGDWTSRDPKITEAIRSYGRAGVPLTVLQIPGEAPVILPSVLTESDLITRVASVKSHLSAEIVALKKLTDVNK